MVLDPANTRSRARFSRGYHREVDQRITSYHPNPALGGTRGSPMWQRIWALATLAHYGDYQTTADTIGCASCSVRQWEEWIHPYRMTGGRQRSNLRGMDQILLCICLFIYTNAEADNICSFIITDDGLVYSR